MRRRRKQQAFTLIEVMVALGVMTVGAMAIIALQQHSIRSNVHARELTIATSVAERWAERLKQDAHTWNRAADPNVPNDDLAVLANTTWLRDIVGVADFTAFQSIAASANASPAFTITGRDSLDAPNEEIKYCVSYRLAWILFGQAMRAEIRVFWARPPLNAGDPIRDVTADFPGCDGPHADLAPTMPLYDAYHMVYMPTVIRMVPVER